MVNKQNVVRNQQEVRSEKREMRVVLYKDN